MNYKYHVNGITYSKTANVSYQKGDKFLIIFDSINEIRGTEEEASEHY